MLCGCENSGTVQQVRICTERVRPHDDPHPGIKRSAIWGFLFLERVRFRNSANQITRLNFKQMLGSFEGPGIET